MPTEIELVAERVRERESEASAVSRVEACVELYKQPNSTHNHSTRTHSYIEHTHTHTLTIVPFIIIIAVYRQQYLPEFKLQFKFLVRFARTQHSVCFCNYMRIRSTHTYAHTLVRI